MWGDGVVGSNTNPSESHRPRYPGVVRESRMDNRARLEGFKTEWITVFVVCVCGKICFDNKMCYLRKYVVWET